MKGIDVAAIQHYIDICFKNAFVSENREMHGGDYKFPFIIVCNTQISEAILLPIANKCRYGRVERTALNRIKKNLYKNFGIHYCMSEDYALDKYQISHKEMVHVDPNHTMARIKYESEHGVRYNYWISYIKRDINYDIDESKPIPAVRLYDMMMTHYKFNSDQELEKFLDEHPYTHLPDDICTDWEKFKELYKETYGKEIDAGFEFYCTDNITFIK